MVYKSALKENNRPSILLPKESFRLSQASLRPILFDHHLATPRRVGTFSKTQPCHPWARPVHQPQPLAVLWQSYFKGPLASFHLGGPSQQDSLTLTLSGYRVRDISSFYWSPYDNCFAFSPGALLSGSDGFPVFQGQQPTMVSGQMKELYQKTQGALCCDLVTEFTR